MQLRCIRPVSVMKANARGVQLIYMNACVKSSATCLQEQQLISLQTVPSQHTLALQPQMLQSG